jgi:hypothetical protein
VLARALPLIRFPLMTVEEFAQTVGRRIHRAQLEHNLLPVYLQHKWAY